jgi:hypothetical protein
LTKEELQKIIEQFDETRLKKLAIFGIAQFGGGSDESFIRANKEGLELFALELLKYSNESETILPDKTKNYTPFDYNEDWIDENSDTFIQHIELITDKQKIKPKVEHITNFKDKLMPFGCGIFFIILVISIIVGIITIFKWLK